MVDGRGTRLRLATARRPQRAPCGRGLPSWHVQPPPCRARVQHDWQAVDPARRPRRRRGQAVGLRLTAVGVRRARLRVRLRPGEPRGARRVGGAVRRLHQRRPGDHRPVRGGGRGQVEPAERARDAVAAWLRGPGARALVGPDRTVPHPGRRGQPADLQRHDGGAVLPPAAAPGLHGAAHTPDHLHAEAGPAHAPDPLPGRGADDGVVRGDPR